MVDLSDHFTTRRLSTAMTPAHTSSQSARAAAAVVARRVASARRCRCQRTVSSPCGWQQRTDRALPDAANRARMDSADSAPCSYTCTDSRKKRMVRPSMTALLLQLSLKALRVSSSDLPCNTAGAAVHALMRSKVNQAVFIVIEMPG
jgi:hypothetical protein